MLLLLGQPAQAIDYAAPRLPNTTMPLGCITLLVTICTLDIKLAIPDTLILGPGVTMLGSIIGSTTNVTLGDKVSVRGRVFTSTGIINMGSDVSISGHVESSTGNIVMGERVSVGLDIFSTTGAIIMGSDGDVSGNIQSSTGPITLGPNVLVKKSVSSTTGPITLQPGGYVKGSIGATTGFVSVGNLCQIDGSITHTEVGDIALGQGVTVNGSVITSDTTSNIGDGSRVKGSINNAGVGVVTLQKNVQVDGDITVVTGSALMGEGSQVLGKVTAVTGNIKVGAYGRVVGMATVVTGDVDIGDYGQVCGNVTSTTGAITLGAHGRIGGYVTVTTGKVAIGAFTVGDYGQIGSYIAITTGAVNFGNYGQVGGYITVTTGDTSKGAVTFLDHGRVGSYITITTGALVTGVDFVSSDASLVIPSTCAVIPVPPTDASSAAGAFECVEKGTLSSWVAEKSATPTMHRLYTKLAGTPFAFDVVALKTDGTLEANYVATGTSAKSVTLELVDGAGSTACTSRAAIAPAVSQRLNFAATDAGRKTTEGMTVSNAYADLRCRVTDTTQTPSVVACSSDNFAVRPVAFVVAQNTPTLNAGSTFSLQATAVKSDLAPATSYTSVPALNSSQITGVPGFTAAALWPQTFAAAINGVSSATFTYDEVGSFTLPASSPGRYGISDSTFTRVDGSTDCVVDSALNTLDGSGKYGCLIGQSTALTVGRFYPDHFDLSPAFAPGCAGGGFTYMDQPFTLGYTVTAKSMSRTVPNPAGNLPLMLYSGGKLNFAALHAGTDWVSRLSPAVTNPLTPIWVNGSYTPTSTRTVFTRPSSTQDATWGPFDALNMGVAVDDADGVGYAASIATFDGTTPTTCSKSAATACRKYASLTGGATTKMRLGRLKLSNAYGSERLSLHVPSAFEYWTINGWLENSLDTCTVLSNNNFAFAFPAGTVTKPNNLAACDSALTVTGSAPAYVLMLSKPSAGKSGWADVTLNLGAVAQGSNTQCTVVGSAGGADVPANMLWLQYNGSNPNARATFGVFKSPLIYRRENY